MIFGSAPIERDARLLVLVRQCTSVLYDDGMVFVPLA